MSGPKELSDYALVLHEADNVATAVRDVPPGEYALGGAGGGERVRVAERIRAGFKLAIRPIARGRAVVKYGHTIGRAEADIQPGECVHVHNVAGTL